MHVADLQQHQQVWTQFMIERVWWWHALSLFWWCLCDPLSVFCWRAISLPICPTPIITFLSSVASLSSSHGYCRCHAGSFSTPGLVLVRPRRKKKLLNKQSLTKAMTSAAGNTVIGPSKQECAYGERPACSLQCPPWPAPTNGNV